MRSVSAETGLVVEEGRAVVGPVVAAYMAMRRSSAPLVDPHACAARRSAGGVRGPKGAPARREAAEGSGTAEVPDAIPGVRPQAHGRDSKASRPQNLTSDLSVDFFASFVRVCLEESFFQTSSVVLCSLQDSHFSSFLVLTILLERSL
ncbi:TPA_asm: hypothetical protein vir530_00024 [dsDNA virus vir530]|jgi:hypothetical protein|nr:TPA_asm: hypothetical protein vir530_00024 [dsDNA virus vir530]